LAVGFLGLATTAGLGLPLSRSLGVEGLGLALSLSSGFQLVAYLLILRRKTEAPLGLRRLGAPLLKMLVASVPAALVAYWICQAGEWAEGPASLLNWALLATAGVAASGIYVGAAWTLGVRELRSWIARRPPS